LICPLDLTAHGVAASLEEVLGGASAPAEHEVIRVGCKSNDSTGAALVHESTGKEIR
jgi:hypothetical protein